MEEIWKDIPGYEGLYQISNLGNVKSLSRIRSNGKCFYLTKEKILKQSLSRKKHGYLCLSLTKNKNEKTHTVHSLMALTFLNHKPKGHMIVIDHINNNPLDNRIENLQIITQRENAYKKQGKYSSSYKGVSFQKKQNKWISRINIKGTVIHLGVFETEIEASDRYKKAVIELNNFTLINKNIY